MHAEEKITYEMTSYSDWPGGEEIAARDYDAAIAKASRHAWLDETIALVATTNLCVAHTVKRELAGGGRRVLESSVARAQRVDGGTHGKACGETAQRRKRC